MIKCVYHGDLDGRCSALIVKKKYPEAQLYEVNYGKDFPWHVIELEDTVIMVDYWLQPFADMIKLKAACDRLVWIDHHESGIVDAQTQNFTCDGVRNSKFAGCELAWDYFFPNDPMPKAVMLLGRWDVWDRTNPDSEYFQYGLRTYDMAIDADHWKYILPLTDEISDEQIDGNVMKIIDEGKTVLSYVAEETYGYMKHYSYERDVWGLRALVVNRGFSNSNVFKSHYNPAKHDIMIAWSYMGNKYSVSLYSEKVDCSAIAREYNGGGHHGAAGYIAKDISYLL